MDVAELITDLQNLTNLRILKADLARIWGIDPAALRRKELAKVNLKIEEIEKVEEYYGLKLRKTNQTDECIEIEHVHINPSCGSGTCVYDVADVTPVKLGKEIIRDILKIKDPKQLKLFIANGDSMEPIIENGDTLLIDTGNIEYSNGGVFLITINENWFIKRLRMKLNGELEVISDNSKYPTETIARNEDIEVKIKGRVIKNLSRGL